uniref:Dihydrolipoamide acetyltransferase component of pyruvate dehydrogenase complex n=1 Tax=Mycena chlorophos TaxID=658473 RepID=A0ABQ0LVQ0_MYCCL|nr:predicted protein [Mycena chlorophos]
MTRLAKAAAVHYRAFHFSHARRAITRLEMPAMSPTMTEGGIAAWKKKQGDAFSAGDVLLEIETDKATIDVEAQDDGVLGLIVVPDGAKNVVVGKVIALLAEEGDDISNLSPPKDDPPRRQQQKQTQSSAPPSNPTPSPAAPSPTPTSSPASSHHTPSHSRPLFPSVHRLLAENNVSEPSKIKGTGVRGMLTKGDVLAFLGKASGPLGTYKEAPPPTARAVKPKPAEPLDGPALRRLIVSTMLQNSLRAQNPPPVAPAQADFDWVLSDYMPRATPRKVPDVRTKTEKCSMNAAVSNLVISLAVMQLARKVPFEDPEVLYYVRVGYVSVQLLVLSVYYYISMTIKSKNDQTVLKYVDAPNPMTQEPGQLVNTTVRDYDLMETSKLLRSVYMGVAMMAFMHGYMKFTQPLFVQGIMAQRATSSVPGRRLAACLEQPVVLKPTTLPLPRPRRKLAGPLPSRTSDLDYSNFVPKTCSPQRR